MLIDEEKAAILDTTAVMLKNRGSESGSADALDEAGKSTGAMIRELFSELESSLAVRKKVLFEVADALLEDNGNEIDDKDVFWLHQEVINAFENSLKDIESKVIDKSFEAGPRDAVPIPWELSMELEDKLRLSLMADRNAALKKHRDENEPVAVALDSNQESVPGEIVESLANFRAAHKDTEKVALIISGPHVGVIEAARKGLRDGGLSGLYAGDKAYHENPYWNTLTYIHGCSSAVVIYAAGENESACFDAAFAAGYLTALEKKIILFKDQTLDDVHPEFAPEQAIEFDIEKPNAVIPLEIEKRLKT